MQKPRVSLSIGGVWRSGLILLMVALVTGCAGPALEDYRDARPQLVPDEFFRGELFARGVVKDFSGEVQTRVWTLEPEGNSYHATAGDVVEPGTMRWQGNAIHMNYVLRVPYNDGTLDVRMDDWMYLVTPDTLINQTTMSKWGIDVGEVVLVIQKHEGREQPAQDR